MVQDDRALAVLMSIHPRWAGMIIASEKTAEVRRSPPAAEGSLLLLYATAPTSAVVAHARITKLHRGGVETLWRAIGLSSGLTKTQFASYLDGASAPGALSLGDVCAIEPQPLSFAPPQSWMWLHPGNAAHRSLLMQVRKRAPLRPPRLGGSS
jgi:predicted transcriptional regulator